MTANATKIHFKDMSLEMVYLINRYFGGSVSAPPNSLKVNIGSDMYYFGIIGYFSITNKCKQD